MILSLTEWFTYLLININIKIERVMVSETTKVMIERDIGHCEYKFIERDELIESKASDKKIKAFYIYPRANTV